MTRPIDHTIDSLRTAVQFLLVDRPSAPPLHEVSRYRSCLLVEFAKPGTTLDNVRVTCEHATQWDDLTAMLLAKLEAEFDERWPCASRGRALDVASDALAALQEIMGDDHVTPARRGELLCEARAALECLVIALYDADQPAMVDTDDHAALEEIRYYTFKDPDVADADALTRSDLLRFAAEQIRKDDIALIESVDTAWALRGQMYDLTAKHSAAVMTMAAMKDASCRIRHAVQAHADALGVDMTLAPVDALERVLEVYAIRCASSRQIRIGDRVRIDELPPGAVGVADQGDVYARNADGKTGRRIRVDFDWQGDPHAWPWAGMIDDGYVPSCWVALLATHDVPAEEIRRVVEENYPNGNPRYQTTIDHNPGDVLTLRDTPAGAVVVSGSKVWHRSPSGRFARIVRANGTWLRDGMAHEWATVASDEQIEVAVLDVPWGRDCADDVTAYEQVQAQMVVPAAVASTVNMCDLPNDTVARVGDDLFMLRDDMGAWLRVAGVWRFRFVWSRDSLAGECTVICSVPPSATLEEIRAIVESKGSES